MARHIGAGRMPVTKTKNDLEHLIHPTPFEYGDVNGVMHNNSADETHKAVYHYPKHYFRGPHFFPSQPWNNSYSKVKRYVYQGSYIGTVS